MKRKIICAFLVLAAFLSLTIAVFAISADTLLYDGADLLSETEEQALLSKLQNVSQTVNAQITVVTIASLDEDVDYYLEYLYDSNNFGYGQNRDGVLLLVCMDPREYRILSNGFAGSIIENAEIDAIGETIVSDLSAGYYADAFDSFARMCEGYLDGSYNGAPFDLGESLLIALVVGLVIGCIVALCLKAQLKSVRKQDLAHAYMKPGSMKITAHSDLFLYRNVTRTRRESKSSSGGSSRSSGGGSF